VIVGNPLSFAIESEIIQAYEQPSLRALGFFLVHVCGRQYGVREPDATMLACSLDEVERRLDARGSHTAPFAKEPDANKIAEAYCNAIYADRQDASYLGMEVMEFCRCFQRDANSLAWAPDGDQAFDDGSHVLHFDVADQVRLIAFTRNRGYLYDPGTITDVWLKAEGFYSILQRWLTAFHDEWESVPKMPIA